MTGCGFRSGTPMVTDGGPDWTTTHTIPTTEFVRGPKDRGDGKPDPRYIQTNLFTLAQIGGLYEVLAVAVEHRHAEILEPWRLDSGAPPVVRYIEHIHHHRRHQEKEENPNA